MHGGLNVQSFMPAGKEEDEVWPEDPEPSVAEKTIEQQWLQDWNAADLGGVRFHCAIIFRIGFLVVSILACVAQARRLGIMQRMIGPSTMSLRIPSLPSLRPRP